MRFASISITVAVFVSVAAGCSEEEEPASPTPTLATAVASQTPEPQLTLSPTSGPTPLPGTPSANFEAFRAFAAEMDTAIASTDAAFFVDRALEVEMVCQGDEALGQCGGQPAGTVIRGIPGSAWRSDAFYIFSLDEYREYLLRYFAADRPSQLDEYGNGSLKLFALGSDDVGSLQFIAIATSIVEEYPTGVPIGEAARHARVFSFVVANGKWRFAGETAATGGTAGEWLSGNCAECYDYWEPWTDS